MPDSTPSDPELPDGWIVASCAFDDEALPTDTADVPQPSVPGHSDAGVVEQFDLVRQALTVPLDIPHDLLHSQIERAIGLTASSEGASGVQHAPVAPVIALTSRPRAPARWLVAAASATILAAGLVVATQGMLGTDDRADVATSNQSKTSESETSERTTADSERAEKLTEERSVTSPSQRSAADLDADAPSAGDAASAPEASALSPVPLLGSFASDEQLAEVVAGLNSSGGDATPSPPPLEPSVSETVIGRATCPGEPTDIVLGQATVAGVPTLVIVRDGVTRFTDLVTCTSRIPPAGR